MNHIFVAGELDDLIREVELFVVVQLLEGWQAGEVDHRRRAAHDGHGVGRRWEQVVFDHLVIDEADAVLPGLRGAVDGVPDLKLLLVLGRQHVQVVAQQNVLFGLIGIEQSQLSIVAALLEDFVDELKHWSDAGAASNHVDLLDIHDLWRVLAQLLDRELSVAEVLKLAGWAAEGNLVSHLHLVEELRHLATIRELGMDVLAIHFHNQVDEAFVVIARNWSVAANDELAFDLCGKIDVLANWKSQNVFLCGQAEAVFASVVRDLLLLDQRQEVLLIWVCERL